MSYTKTNWTKGDVITAEKLNKIESGIEQASASDSGSGGGSGIEIKANLSGDFDPLPIGLTASDFIGAVLVTYNGETPISYLPAIGIYPSEEQITIRMADSRNGQLLLRSLTYNRGSGEVTAS